MSVFKKVLMQIKKATPFSRCLTKLKIQECLLTKESRWAFIF